MNYDFSTKPDRILAFMDILGFSNLVKENDIDGLESKEKFKNIFDLINDFYTKHDDEDPERNYPEIKFLWMSDTIVVSAEIVDAEAVINNLLDIQHDLLCSGLPVRGAICIGRLYHEENIWGEALVRAAEIEKKYSIYPRILITNEDYRKISLSEEVKKYFINDESNSNYRYIEPVSNELDRAIENEYVYLNIEKIFSMIEANYYKNMHIEKIAVKWEWLAKITKRSLMQREKEIKDKLNKEQKENKSVSSYEEYIERLSRITDTK